MKRLLTLFIVSLLIACQQQPFDQGKQNAIQYVNEQFPLYRDDIASVEVIKTDTLLSDIALIFEMTKFAKAGTEFLQNNISRGEYQNIIDERESLINDINNSWSYKSVNDSLKRLTKFDGMWRRVYTIRITMKSSDVKEQRIMMENDGIKPYIIESKFIQQLEEYERKIAHARMNLFD